MPVSLVKGQKVSITKGNTGLNKLLVGVGWDVNQYDGGEAFDLDSEVFLVGANGKVTRQEDFIFFGNLKHPSGAVEHMGDNRTGEGDDEKIKIDLSKVPPAILKIVVAVTIYEPEQRKQNFGQVSNAYIRIVDEEKQEELLKYDLGEDFSIETAVVFGEIYKNGLEWKFNAIGNGYQGGLAALCSAYGIEVE